MSALADATKSVPFSNGTEGDAWMSKWCAYCVHDHASHDETYDPNGLCKVIGLVMVERPFRWPEVWLPEPDDGSFALPSRLICGQFEGCTEGGCTGDPGADERAERVTEVTVYWRDRATS